MSKFSFRQYRDEIKELLEQFENLKAGRTNSFLEEESFERLIDYFDDSDKLSHGLEVANYGIQQYPYSAILLIKKADLLISLRRYAEGLFVLEQAELLDGRDKDLYILKTEAFLALDKQAQAASVLEAAIQDFEGDEKLDLLFELTDVYDDFENFEKVFDCLKLILELEPTNEEALYKICFWADFTNRNEDSLVLHQKIINEAPFCELAWFNLAAAYQGLKLYEKSIDAYQYAVAIDEKFDYAYRNMGDAYIRLRKYKNAIESLEKVIELSRPEDIVYEAIGHCFDKMKNYAQARFNYKKALHLNLENNHLYYKIGITYMSEQNWQMAIKNLDLGLQKQPLNPDFNLAIGQSLMELGKIDEAITYFGNVVRAKLKNINGWVALLQCLYKASLFSEALAYANIAFEHTNKKPIFIFYRAAILFAMGKNKEAVLQLKKGMNINPKMIKKIIPLNPAMLQNQQVIELLGSFKKR